MSRITHRRSASLVFLAAVLAGFAVGCGADSSAPGDNGAKQSAEVSITKVDYKQFDEEVARHKGKVVVVDLWGLWCSTCMKKFPDVVKLSEKYADKGVVFMSLCLPLSEQEKDPADALAFLKKVKATFPNFLLDDLEWGEHFNIEGAPTMRVYGKDGKLAQQFSPGVPSLDWTLDDVEKVVQDLIEKQ